MTGETSVNEVLQPYYLGEALVFAPVLLCYLGDVAIQSYLDSME